MTEWFRMAAYPQETLLVILGIAMVLILSNRVRPDVVALLIMLALSGFQLVTPEEALRGFSQPTLMALAGLFVITQALDANGVIHWLGQNLERLGQGSELRMVGAFMLAGAVLSMVMNNIAAGSVLLPAALSACRRHQISPSRLLLPLAYGILLGGMATLFTTANLVVSGTLASLGHPSLTMVDFLKVGGSLAILGMLYTLVIGRKMLPRTKMSPAESIRSPDLLETYGVPDSLYEARLLEDSPLVGQSLREMQIGSRFGVSVLGVLRGHNAYFNLQPDKILEADDVLLLLGDLERVQLLSQEGVELGRVTDSSARGLPVRLGEAIVSPRSRAIGKTLIQIRLRHQFGVTVVGLWRRGVAYLTDVSNFRLQPGDALLVIGQAQRFEAMAQSRDFLIPEMPPQLPGSKPRAILTLLAAGFAMAVAVEGILPMALAMLAGAALLVTCRCLSAEEAYNGVEWNIIVLIAAMTPVGTALHNTGLAASIAQSLSWFLQFGPHAFEMANFFLAVTLTQMVGGQVAALVLAPLTLSSAVLLASAGVSPAKVGLAVAIGCSTAFLTPIAHPVNILMMGPGGYRGSHFVKVGLPLTLLCSLGVGILLWLT